MDDLTIARALHILALVHWIGGVSLVTLVILPGIMRAIPEADRMKTFEAIEGRFSFQAKISTLLAGVTGFYMTHRLDAWERFADPHFFWMHAMVALWAIFTFVLFVAEPLFLHRWFHQQATRDPAGTFAKVLRLHQVLTTLSVITIFVSMLGAHGAIG